MLLGLHQHDSLAILLFGLEGNVKLALKEVANLSKSQLIDLSILLYSTRTLSTEDEIQEILHIKYISNYIYC